MKQFIIYFSFLVFITNWSCTNDNNQNKKSQLADNKKFREYWYAEKAEINSYDLKQALNGNINDGEAVMVFVTEDFRIDSQVKLETEDHSNAKSVLKLNFIKKFVTGVYDNSMYSSVFTPVQVNELPATLKVVTTTQDWGGQTFTQLNFRHNGYQIFGKSYSEADANDDYHIDYELLEDEIWNKIRVSPERLPEGKLLMIPSIMSLKLRHKKIEAELAEATLVAYQDSTFHGKNLMKYAINYPNSRRSLSIFFDKNFPYQIMGWEETYSSNNKMLTTKATLKASIMNPYWKKNTPIDTVFRKLLKL